MIVLKILVGFALFIGMMVLVICVIAALAFLMKTLDKKIKNEKVRKFGKSFDKVMHIFSQVILVIIFIVVVLAMSFSFGDNIL